MFRLRWHGGALRELADVWVRADSVERQAITEASQTIEQQLRADPERESESRPNGRRITFVAPLAVTFRIEAGQQLVSILHVRMFRRRKK